MCRGQVSARVCETLRQIAISMRASAGRRLVLALSLALLGWPAAVRTSATALAPPRLSGPPVTGVAWDAHDAPISGARVRLRNVKTAKIAAAAQADEAGRFSFDEVEPDQYAVELVDAKGHVLAVGQMFTVSAGDAVATFVRLGGRVPGMAALFGNAAAAVVSSAAGLGITAVTPTGTPVSPETPPPATGIR